MSLKKHTYYFLTMLGFLNLSLHASQSARAEHVETDQPRKRCVRITEQNPTDPAPRLTSPSAQPLEAKTQPLQSILKNWSYVPTKPPKTTMHHMTREERLEAMMSRKDKDDAVIYAQKLKPLQLYFQAEYKSRQQCHLELAKHKNPLQPAPPFTPDSEDMTKIIRLAAQRQGSDLKTLIRQEYPGEEKMALVFSRYITNQSRFFKPVTANAP